MSLTNISNLKKSIKDKIKSQGFISHEEILYFISKKISSRNMRTILKEYNLKTGYILICPRCHSTIGPYNSDELKKGIICPECNFEFHPKHDFEKVYFSSNYIRDKSISPLVLKLNENQTRP
ncbi:hypothetical protein [Marinitoga sp. 1155]|uniref:hypothetical protein n=1 Tax=Marinitoga sp. 1155 TaxID=1428448 RepID=UPI000641222F|nr:hypothetical protein [Marinitoga sp. 1155]AMS33998.1 hypothetical protein UF09_56 [Marinitoga camini virus 2]KLO24784.1 hypothetical protein X274_02175 [Marinitoga sp. 1155]